MILLIQQEYAKQVAYASIGLVPDPTTPTNSSTSAPRKEIQCTFRLLNLLFSDAFAEDFGNLGNVASRQLLDNGTAANDQHFWTRVQTEFVSSETPTVCNLSFTDDPVFANKQHQINPAKVVRHDWKKLRLIWKGLNADYKAALTRYTVSGTHEQNFFQFCNGKLDTYYLRRKLDEKPQLNDTVAANLPEQCALSSEGTSSFVPEEDGGGAVSSSSVKKRKHKGNNKNDIVEAIRLFCDSKRRAEMAVQKMNYMTKEERRREKKNKMEEWEFLKGNIEHLRSTIAERMDLSYNSREDEDQEVLDGFLKRRRELAKELGLME